MNRDHARLDATAQAELARSGAVSAVELVEAAIARIEAIDLQVGAVVAPLFDEARAHAASPAASAGPFAGVPSLLKDAGACQAGVPHSMGNAVLRDVGWRCPQDSPLGRRLRRAGLVTLGTSKTPELASQPTTQPAALGPTRNPWDLARSTSGSSGGAAAAVAARMVPIAHASDVSGSIRLPAAWCGVVGLKPSRGRTPIGPLITRSLVEHVITWSVRDTAAALDALAGPEPGDLFIAPPAERPYASEVGADPGRLRVGIATGVDASGIDVHPDCAGAAEEACHLLESLGHVVEPATPPALFDDAFVAHWLATSACELRGMIEGLGPMAGRPLVAADLEPYTWAFAALGPASAGEYMASAGWQQIYASRVAHWWADGFDLLVTPTTGEPPALLEELIPPAADPLTLLPRFERILCFTVPFNVTGQPAVSLPLAWSDDGLPLGVQLVTALGREDLLIRVASQLEEARPWADRLPSLAAVLPDEREGTRAA